MQNESPTSSNRYHRHQFLLAALILVLCVGTWFAIERFSGRDISGAPPYGVPESEAPPLSPWEELRQNWTRPEGPAKVALQIGHLNNQVVPQELENLRGNTGAQAGGFTEVEVNQQIAELTASLLRERGVEVDLLPTLVPPDYWADAFVAIHADGSTDPTTTGFKIAGPWRDLTGKSDELAQTLEKSYQAATNLRIDPNVTRNMRGYYAFAWWRYEHSIHPMTTAVIVETGFLTNWSDRQLIAGKPEIPAKALANGITQYLQNQGLLQSE